MLNNIVFLLIIFIMSSCSYSKTKSSAETDVEALDATAFEGLQTVRVIPSFISKQVYSAELRKTLIEQLEKIGTVHVPTDTSIEEVQKAQNRKFGLLILSIKEISVYQFEKFLPIIDVTFTLYEETELMINKKNI